MKIKGKYASIILVVTIIFSTTGFILYTSCKPPMPTKLLPAYTFDIDYPSQEGFVTVGKKDSIILPVTVRSLVDEPIKIRPRLTAPSKVPEFISYEVPQEFVTLNPRDSINTQITIKVSQDAPPGTYMIGITGELQEPVKERAGTAMMFNLEVK